MIPRRPRAEIQTAPDSRGRIAKAGQNRVVTGKSDGGRMSRKARRKPGSGKNRAGKRPAANRSAGFAGPQAADARGRSSKDRRGGGTPGRNAPGAAPPVDEDAAPTDLSALESGKLYYRIGEVSQITGVKPYVLRYWESEFRLMAPQKSRSKQRLYRKKDIETILHIKQLLYEERYTIAGARQRLRELGAAGVHGSDPEQRAAARAKPSESAAGVPSDAVDGSEYRRIHAELVEIRALLSADL